MKQTLLFTLISFCFVVLSGCCDEMAQDYIIIEYIDVMSFNEDYFEDDIDEGFPELYAIIRIDGETYFTSEVSYNQALPVSIDLESFLFIGEELNSEVKIFIYDYDTATTEDPIGNVTFVPNDFLLQRNRRETVNGGFLEIDLLLKWECDS